MIDIHELRLGDKVIYDNDGNRIPATIIALIDMKECHYNQEVLLKLDRKMTGNANRVWVDAIRLTLLEEDYE